MEPKNRPPHPGEDRCPGCNIRIVDAGGEAPTALYLDRAGKVTNAGGTWVCSSCIDSGFDFADPVAAAKADPEIESRERPPAPGTPQQGTLLEVLLKGVLPAAGVIVDASADDDDLETIRRALFDVMPLPIKADMRREEPAEQRARELAAELLETEDKLTEARRQVRELVGIVGAVRRALCLHIDRPDSDVVGEVARYIACAAQGEQARDRLLRLAEAARDARDLLAEAIDSSCAYPNAELVDQAHQRLELFGLGDGEEGEDAEAPAAGCTGEVALTDEVRDTQFVEAFYLSGDRTGLRFKGMPDICLPDENADRLALVLSTGGELQRYDGPGALPLTIREVSRTLEIRIGFDALAARIGDAYVLPEVVVTDPDHLAHELIERLKVNDGDPVIDGIAAEVYSDIPWNELEPLGLRAVHEPGDEFDQESDPAVNARDEDFEPLSGGDEEDDGDV